MSVLILYNEPGSVHAGSAEAREADADVLTQVAWVRQQLHRLGYDTQELGVTLDLTPLDQLLRMQRPELAVYLVESLGGTDALLHLPAELLEAYEIPFTGSPCRVLKSLSSKSAVKQRFLQSGLPTAPWLDAHGQFFGGFIPGQYIIKADREHASRGLDSSSVVHATNLDDLRQQCRDRAHTVGLPCIAERFIWGREFNLSVLDSGSGTPTFLPLAEIDFEALPADRLPIVDWNAKWAEDSVEYHGTPRLFPDMSMQVTLREELLRAALRCWEEFDLQGYARVDFRVDPKGRIWILEINANPCLSPNAGFYAACEAAGLEDDSLQMLLAAAFEAH